MTIRRLIIPGLLLLATLWLAPFSVAQDSATPGPVTGTQDYYLQVDVSNTRPYVGEQIAYVLRYYAFNLPDPYPYSLPEFEGFWLSRVLESSDTRIETLGNRQFYVGEAIAEITPLLEGELMISPAVLDIRETVFRDGVRLESEQVSIDVQPLPLGAPEQFDGAVGQFDMSVAVDSTEVQLGQPVMLTITIDGTGNLELIPQPAVPDAPGWRVFTTPARYEESPLGGLRFGQKTFTWTLIPQQTGTLGFPGVAFAYFDPLRREYQTLRGESFSVDVFPGPAGQSMLAQASDVSDSVSDVLALKAVGAGLTRQTDSVPAGWIWTLWLLPPVGLAGFVIVRMQMAANQDRRTEYRRQNALKRALERLDSIDPNQPADHLEMIVYAYIADKRLVGMNELRRSDLKQWLITQGINTTLAREVHGCVAEAEGLRYAMAPLPPARLPGIMRRLIIALDAAWTDADGDPQVGR